MIDSTIYATIINATLFTKFLEKTESIFYSDFKFEIVCLGIDKMKQITEIKYSRDMMAPQMVILVLGE